MSTEKTMLRSRTFHLTGQAFNYTKKIVAELACSHCEYQVVYSKNEGLCREGGGSFEDMSAALYQFLTLLDEDEGYMVEMKDRETKCNYWDWLPWSKPSSGGLNNIDSVRQNIFVSKKSGFAIIYNSFGILDGDFPIVILKKPFHDMYTPYLSRMIRSIDIPDYTMKFSPAIYIQVFMDYPDGVP